VKWSRKHTAAFSFVILAAVAAVLTPFISSMDGVVDPMITLTSEGVELGGPEVVVLTGHHLVTVHLNGTVEGGIRGIPLSVYHFYARTVGGADLWSSGLVEVSEMYLEPESYLEFSIYFEVPDGDSLSLVEYREPSGETIVVPLPQ